MTRKIVAIILVSLIVQAVFITFFDLAIVKDAKRFDRLAVNLSKGLGFTEDGENPSWLYPGAPLVFGTVYAVFGHHPLAVKILQALLFAALCVLIYGIGRSCFGEKAGFISALACALYPPLFALPDILLSEFLFTFSLAVLMFLYVLSIRRDSNLIYGLVGAFSAWLSYMRPNGLFVIFFLIAWMYIILFKDFKRFLRFAAVSILFFIIFMLPVTIKNYIAFGKFIPVAGIESVRIGEAPEEKLEESRLFTERHVGRQMTLVKGYYEEAGIEVDEKAQVGEELKGPMGKLIPQDYTWRPKNVIDGLRRLYIGSYSDIYQIGIPLAFFFKDKRLIDEYPWLFTWKLLLLLLSSLMCVLAVFGFLFGIRRFMDFSPVFLILGYNSFFYLLYVFTWQTDITTRYGLPVLPYIMMFAVSGVVLLIDRLRGVSHA